MRYYWIVPTQANAVYFPSVLLFYLHIHDILKINLKIQQRGTTVVANQHK